MFKRSKFRGFIKNIEYEKKYKRQYHGNYAYTVGDWSACLLIASDHEPTCAEYRCKKSRRNGNIYCIVS